MADAARASDAQARRRRIMAAARTVFAAKGGLSAGLRPIAAEAGCTTGAIYAVFSGKEEIYAALLEESLTALAATVAGAAAREPEAAQALRAAVFAFHEYYERRPFEADLGLYLFDDQGAKGLGAERDAALNALLEETLAVFEACFRRLGAPSGDDPLCARARAHALFAAVVGAGVIASARRDRSIRTNARTMLETTIAASVASLGR